MLLLAAILVGTGFWMILRSRFLLAALVDRHHALRSTRGVSLIAITIVAVGAGLAGLGCRILVLAVSSR